MIHMWKEANAVHDHHCKIQGRRLSYFFEKVHTTHREDSSLGKLFASIVPPTGERLRELLGRDWDFKLCLRLIRENKLTTERERCEVIND